MNSQLSEINPCLFLLSTVLLQLLSYPGLFCVYGPSATILTRNVEGPHIPGFRLLFHVSHLGHCNASPSLLCPLIFPILARLIFLKLNSDQIVSQLKNFPRPLITHGRVEITCLQTFKIMCPSVKIFKHTLPFIFTYTLYTCVTVLLYYTL